MSTYALFMIVGLIVVVGGWIAYFVWDYKERKEEENQPKPRSEQVKKTKSEIRIGPRRWPNSKARPSGPPKANRRKMDDRM